MSSTSTSTAALEYNTNGELTIKNRQIESAGNSLKFKTINSELTSENINKLIDIKQNNNSRLSIDEIGTGAIKIERNEVDPEDLKYSAIKIESNTESNTESKPSSDVNHDLTVNPYGVSLGTSVYSEDDNKSIHSIRSRYIDINTINKNEGSINLQNNKYQLDGNNEFKLNGQKEFIRDSYSNINLGLSDLQLGVAKEESGKTYKSYMNFHIDNGITIDSEQHDFTIKNNDYTISAFTDVPTPTLKFECVPDTSKPDTTKTLMEMTKSSVNINSLSIGSDNNKPIITDIASSSLSPTAEDDQILPTIGYVKTLIPNFNITNANKFYLQPSGADSKIFYLAYQNGSDNTVYGLKVTFDGTNTPTVTGFKGTVNDGKITES